VIVIFDLDGTVWDSEPGIVASLAHTLERLDLPVPPASELVPHIGPPLHLMLADLGVPADRIDDGVAAYRERYLASGVFESSLYPGIESVLGALADRGVRLATATSKGEVPTATMLDHFGLRPYFEVVGAATMDGTATTKTEVLARALAALGHPHPALCRMVGDRHYDVVGAARFDIPCIGAAWGYGGAEELRLAGAIAVAERPAELVDLLR
jgi:phosphoglycolate phosphatase